MGLDETSESVSINSTMKTLKYILYFPQSVLSLIIKVRADDSDDNYCSEYEEWQPGLDGRSTAHVFTWEDSNILLIGI